MWKTSEKKRKSHLIVLGLLNFMNSDYISLSKSSFLSFTCFNASCTSLGVNLSAHFEFLISWVFFILRSIINFLYVSLSMLAFDVSISRFANTLGFISSLLPPRFWLRSSLRNTFLASRLECLKSKPFTISVQRSLRPLAGDPKSWFAVSAWPFLDILHTVCCFLYSNGIYLCL